MAHHHRLFEIVEQLPALRVEQPVLQNDDFLAVDVRSIDLFDDQGTAQTTRDLLV